MTRSMRRWMAGMLLIVLAPASWAGVLTVEAVSGAASLQRAAAASAPVLGQDLLEGDRLGTGDGGSVTVNLSRHGFLQMGAGAELVVEQAPLSSYAEDLRTVLRLERGVLRLVWKYAAQTSSWPLLVYFRDQRVSLRSGEYFFELAEPGLTALCVASGEAQVGAPGSFRPQPLAGPACYRLHAAAPAQKFPRTQADFIAARGELRITDLLETPAPLPAAVPAALPAPLSEPAPLPQAGRTWTVHVASGTHAAEAERAVARLRAAGLPAETHRIELEGRNWYRVQISGIADHQAARGLRERMKTEFGYRNPWLQQR